MITMLLGAGPSIVFVMLYTIVFQAIMEGAPTRVVTRRYLVGQRGQ